MVHDESEIVPVEDIELDEKLNYTEQPIAIVDSKTQELRNGKVVRLVLVRWKHHKGSELTWEREEEMREGHPHLFETSTSGTKSIPEGGIIVTSRE